MSDKRGAPGAVGPCPPTFQIPDPTLNKYGHVISEILRDPGPVRTGTMHEWETVVPGPTGSLGPTGRESYVISCKNCGMMVRQSMAWTMTMTMHCSDALVATVMDT